MILAIVIFFIAYAAIASEKFPRHWVALLGGGMLIVFGVLTPFEALAMISWETLGLIAGMFVLVGILQEAGFFSWLAMAAMKKVNYHPTYLFAILLLLSAFLAAFMGSITVMLFLAALTIQICQLLKLDPIPLIIAEVCAANTGGSGTLVGDPPNIVLGTALGFNFADFAAHTGPIAIVLAFLLLAIFLLINRKVLKNARAALTDETITEIEALHNEPVHAHLSRTGLIGFAVAIILLIFHSPLSALSGLPINTALSALLPAGVALLALQHKQRKQVLLKIDGESILFFAGLFLLIGGLEKVHIFNFLAEKLSQVKTVGPDGLVALLAWAPGLASGIVDNVPLALAMSYVLKDLAEIPGMPALSLMVWSLTIGVDIGGNLTPIGASANVVAYSYMEKNSGAIGWKRWLLIAVPPTIAIMIVGSILIYIKSRIGWY
ncbi:MAG: hypothetical protein JXA13_03160 [Anaerolineales bacterium]|nr:hypothetical protein [Anaerolineales bacterium]